MLKFQFVFAEQKIHENSLQISFHITLIFFAGGRKELNVRQCESFPFLKRFFFIFFHRNFFNDFFTNSI